MTSERSALALGWLDDKYETRSLEEQRALLRLEPSVLALLAGYHALGGFTDDEAPALVQAVRIWMETKAR
jgi:hypothetical protein